MRALALVALLFASPCFAADLGQAPIPVPSPTTWTGFYAGANVGGAWATVNSPGESDKISGFIGGGQVGYNYQFGKAVIGAEGDFDGSTQSLTTGIVKQQSPWLATLRGRVGYTTGPVLIYATGGGAWVDYKLSATGFGTSESSKLAWTVGGGAEWMFAPKWSVKAEYLYIGVENASTTLAGQSLVGSGYEHIARVGVNYHF